MRRHDYLPFGEENFSGLAIRSAANGFQQDGVRQKHTGYERDGETGLDFAQARYYSNIQGRFTGPDAPFADQFESDPQSWNLYAYVRNNPCVNTDPRGRETCYFNGNQVLACEGAKKGTYRIDYENNLIYVRDKKGNEVPYELDARFVVRAGSPAPQDFIFEMGRRAPALQTIVTGAGIYAGAMIALPTIGLAAGGSSLTTLGLSQPTLPIATRLALLWSRVSQSRAARNAEEALEQIGRILDEVEDTFSGVPKNPNPGLRPDGRMYRPQSDNITRHPDGSITAKTRGHRIEISKDGAINVLNKKTGQIEFTKPGAGQ
jgi:RHS repeat-associated protein